MTDKKVTIVPATVSVSLLHVDGKQMTLAFFKQIEVWTGIPDSCNILGRVDYGIKGRGDRWFVFIIDGQIGKTVVIDESKEGKMKSALQEATEYLRTAEAEAKNAQGQLAHTGDDCGQYEATRLKGNVERWNEIVLETEKEISMLKKNIPLEIERARRYSETLEASPQLFIAA